MVEFAQGNEGNKLTIATPSLTSSINDLFTERWEMGIHVEWALVDLGLGEVVDKKKVGCWYDELW